MNIFNAHIFTSILALIFFAETSRSEVITVCAGCEMNSLKSAITQSRDNDTILVKSGTYFEYDIGIDKPVVVRGDGDPVIDVNFRGSGLTLRSPGIVVTGLTIINIAVNYLSEPAGIRIDNTYGCIIENNKFENTFFAVYIAGSNSCIVKNNLIHGNSVTESSSGNGIHLWKCSHIQIVDNKISGHRDGIYLEFAHVSNVIRNESSNNLRYGLHFMFSDSNNYDSNLFEQNGAGVAVMYSKNVSMSGNEFRNNWGDNSYGLLLKELYDGTIEENKFTRNTTAIFVEGSNRIDIRANLFSGNGWALKIMGSCFDNNISENDFTSNTFDVTSNSSSSNNKYFRNYWDKYKGYDLNRDNIGDVPFRPVSLFSKLIERTPESIIMLRSLIVDMLDAIEKVLPSIIPESLIDDQPSMISHFHGRNS